MNRVFSISVLSGEFRFLIIRVELVAPPLLFFFMEDSKSAQSAGLPVQVINVYVCQTN